MSYNRDNDNEYGSGNNDSGYGGSDRRDRDRDDSAHRGGRASRRASSGHMWPARRDIFDHLSLGCRRRRSAQDP